jgi:hypothetical protein
VCLEEDFARAVAVGPRFAGVWRGRRCSALRFRGGAGAVGDFWGGGEGAVVGVRPARRGFGEARAWW